MYKNKKHLPKGIYIDREYTEETEKTRKLLRPILRLAKSIPKYKGKSKLEEDYLVVQGKKYMASNIHKLPEDINGFATTSKTDDNTLAFFGELNPFSNFHITPFELNGKSYHSSEQYIQEAKPLFFKDNLSAKSIMDVKTPLECKNLSCEITGYNHEEWKLCAKEQCKPGIAAKFSSSSALIQLLHSTGDKMIVEACHDQL